MNVPVIIRDPDPVLTSDDGKVEQKNTALLTPLSVLVVIAILYTLYFCQTLLLPIFVAGLIALFSSPLVRCLVRFKLPQGIAAAVVVFLLIVFLSLTFVFLAAPAAHWIESLPELGDKLSGQIEGLSDKFNLLKSQVIPDADQKNDAIGAALETAVFSMVSLVAGTTAFFLMQVAAVFVITYFFLVYGDNLMRNFVRAQSSFSEKKKSVIIFQAVRDEISRYALLVSIINMGLGVATATMMMLLGVDDPLLWGALATILNFAPYIGPLVLSVILLGVGLIEYQGWGMAFVVPSSFLLLNFIESQLVTPTILGQRFNMNPLLVVLWMFTWGWLWGVVGFLIAIPLLVCFKILSSHLNLMGCWVHVLDGDRSINKDSVTP